MHDPLDEPATLPLDDAPPPEELLDELLLAPPVDELLDDELLDDVPPDDELLEEPPVSPEHAANIAIPTMHPAISFFITCSL